MKQTAPNILSNISTPFPNLHPQSPPPLAAATKSPTPEPSVATRKRRREEDEEENTAGKSSPIDVPPLKRRKKDEVIEYRVVVPTMQNGTESSGSTLGALTTTVDKDKYAVDAEVDGKQQKGDEQLTIMISNNKLIPLSLSHGSGQIDGTRRHIKITKKLVTTTTTKSDVDPFSLQKTSTSPGKRRRDEEQNEAGEPSPSDIPPPKRRKIVDYWIQKPLLQNEVTISSNHHHNKPTQNSSLTVTRTILFTKSGEYVSVSIADSFSNTKLSELPFEKSRLINYKLNNSGKILRVDSRILNTCLAKNNKVRWTDIDDSMDMTNEASESIVEGNTSSSWNCVQGKLPLSIDDSIVAALQLPANNITLVPQKALSLQSHDTNSALVAFQTAHNLAETQQLLLSIQPSPTSQSKINSEERPAKGKKGFKAIRPQAVTFTSILTLMTDTTQFAALANYDHMEWNRGFPFDPGIEWNAQQHFDFKDKVCRTWRRLQKVYHITFNNKGTSGTRSKYGPPYNFSHSTSNINSYHDHSCIFESYKLGNRISMDFFLISFSFKDSLYSRLATDITKISTSDIDQESLELFFRSCQNTIFTWLLTILNSRFTIDIKNIRTNDIDQEKLEFLFCSCQSYTFICPLFQIHHILLLLYIFSRKQNNFDHELIYVVVSHVWGIWIYRKLTSSSRRLPEITDIAFTYFHIDLCIFCMFLSRSVCWSVFQLFKFV